MGHRLRKGINNRQGQWRLNVGAAATTQYGSCSSNFCVCADPSLRWGDAAAWTALTRSPNPTHTHMPAAHRAYDAITRFAPNPCNKRRRRRRQRRRDRLAPLGAALPCLKGKLRFSSPIPTLPYVLLLLLLLLQLQFSLLNSEKPTCLRVRVAVRRGCAAPVGDSGIVGVTRNVLCLPP